MKERLRVFIGIIVGLALITGSVSMGSQNVSDIKTRTVKPGQGTMQVDLNFGTFPLYFITNRGQVNKTARFYAKTSRYTLWLTTEGLVFDSTVSGKIRGKGYGVRGKKEKTKEGAKRPSLPFTPYPLPLNRDVSRLFFLNAAKDTEIVPIEETKLRVNYLKGKNRSKWFGDIPTSRAVLYKRLYNNIDLKVYGIEKQIEYDWIVKPGGNPGDIRFKYKNVKETRLDKEGNLIIETAFGLLMHKRPVCFQTLNNKRFKVNAEFKRIGKNSYGFEVGEYDTNRVLIIDPVVLAYSTYLGKEAEDYVLGIAVDAGGYLYATGETYSNEFPVLDQYQGNQSQKDAFIVKMDLSQSGASSLLYSTYFGGANTDRGRDIAVDNNGIVYVAGNSDSPDFPVLNEFMDPPSNWEDNIFIVKLDTTQSGSEGLLYSTMLAGSEDDYAAAIAIDGSGKAYIAGTSYSSNYPTLNAYQEVLNGSRCAVVSVIDTTLSGSSSLLYSTFMGGSGDEYIGGVAVDGSGHVYFGGYTRGGIYPTRNEYMGLVRAADAFATKLDPTKSGDDSLLYSTMLGGFEEDYCNGFTADDSGNVYFTGHTYSEDFPILNSYQSTITGAEAYITILDTNLGPDGLVYSTLIGGDGTDSGYDVKYDDSGNLYILGATGSTDFPTLNPYQTAQSDYDCFVLKLTPSLGGTDALIYSTYLGGNDMDIGYSLALDGNNDLYIGGATLSTDFPIQNQYQTDQTVRDGFISKLRYITLPTVTTTVVSAVTTDSAASGGNVTSNGNETVSARGICWSITAEPTLDDGFTTDGSGTGDFPSSLSGLTSDTPYYVRAYATNAVGTAYGNEETFQTNAPSITVTSPNGGESLDVNSVQDIAWTSEGIDGNVMIEYSIDNGGSWITIVQSTENDGNYNWTVPNRPSPDCLIRISETDQDNGPTDTSDAVFSIVSPNPGSLTLRSPNGGEGWTVRTAQAIRWKSTGDINYVTLDYSRDNGTTWITIAQPTANDDYYLWVVPNTVSDECLVRITAIDGETDPKPSDVSDAVFSILRPSTPVMDVTAPNGGEQLVVGSRFTITWDPSNSRAEAFIEYSTDNGQNWMEIAPVTENDGKHDWTIPDEPSETCLVRISEIGGQPSDVSDAIFSIVSPLSDDVVVTAPNGGENWEAGSTREIAWTTNGNFSSVAITHSIDNGVTWRETVSSTPDDGSYEWTVPYTVSDECLVRVTVNDGVGDPKPSDVSDEVFSITFPSTPTIKVNAPNGGEQLLIGSRFEITWFATNSRVEAQIEYSTDGGDNWTDIAGATENDGSYDWTVPDEASGTCLIKVSETSGQPVDISDAVFSIVPPLFDDITVTAPNGGESYTVGSVHEITWTENGEFTNVTIEHSTDNGNTWQFIIETTPNDGSYDWTVPETLSGECLVRVTANDDDLDPKPSDVSDEVFSIVSALPGDLRVTSPNGGESWEVGSTHAITWIGSGNINDVAIDYSTDNGYTWSTVIASVGNDGSYDWTLPFTVSDECLVRVMANDGGGDPIPSDVSDSEFSIVFPSSPIIRVITPNGGEQAVVGTVYKITWFGTDTRAESRIEYSVNGGGAWTEITGATENDGDYDWLVPDEPSETCLVRVIDTSGQPVDISDAVFSIVSAQTGDLTVLTPNGGETLEAGAEYNISWSAIGINNVVIEFSANNGGTWDFIAGVPADNGNYPWTVPGTPSNECLIRISGADSDENPVDVSDLVFKIEDPSQDSIEVFTPNGGESLTVGEEYYITWGSSGLENVKIEYSVNNGETWEFIESVPAIRGRYTWVVPGTPSPDCLVRISGDDTPEDPSDVSDSLFSISSD